MTFVVSAGGSPARRFASDYSTDVSSSVTCRWLPSSGLAGNGLVSMPGLGSVWLLGLGFLSELVDSLLVMGMDGVERFDGSDGDGGDGAAGGFGADGFGAGGFGAGFVEGSWFEVFGQPGPVMPDDVETVGLLAGLEPGPAAMMILGGVDTSELDPAGRVEVAAGWQRQLAWVSAQAQFALADVLQANDEPKAATSTTSSPSAPPTASPQPPTAPAYADATTE
jgi:hypothetical protein